MMSFSFFFAHLSSFYRQTKITHVNTKLIFLNYDFLREKDKVLKVILR